MPFSPRQTGFLGAARTLDSYSGWSDDEISNNINEVLSSGDQNRISGLSSALGGLGSYEGWQPEEIQSNITEIFKPAPIEQPAPIEKAPVEQPEPLQLPPAPEQLPPTEIPEPTLTMTIPEEPVGEFQLKQDFPGYQPEFPAATTKQLPIEEGVDIQPVGTLKEGTKQVGRTGAGFVKGLHEAGRETLKKESAKMDEYAKQAEARGDFKYAKYLREQIAPALKEESDRLDKVSKVADKVLKSEILKTDPEWKKATGLKRYVQDVIMMVPQLVGQIGATTLTGGVGGIMFMGVQIAGGQYEDLIAKGVEPERAFGSAMVNAAIQAPLEQISLKFMTKLWKPGGKLVENLVGASTAAGSEFLTEWVQKYPELATDIWATTKGESLDKRMKEFGRRVGEVTKEGIYEGLVAAPLGFLGGAAGKTGATIAETVPPTQKPTVQDLETTLPGISQAPEVVQEEPDLLPPMQEPTVSELETVSEPKTVEPIVEEKIKKAEVAPKIEKVGEGTEAAKDRRKDLEKRKRIEEMSPEEMIQALSVDELTGSMSTRKWNDIEKLPAQGTLDVDGLKWFNDKMGHDSGDMLLKEIVKSMQESGVEIARIGEGDEFRFQEKNVKDIDKKVKNAYNILKDKTIEITKPDGSTITVKGLGFSYGTAENADYEAAKLESDQKLNEHKLERESAGLRGGRAKEPPGVSRQAPEGVKDQPYILESAKLAKDLIETTSTKEISSKVEELWGGISEERFNELDDGAEFENKEERKYYHLANKHAANLEYAVKNRDVDEAESIITEVKKGLAKISPKREGATVAATTKQPPKVQKQVEKPVKKQPPLKKKEISKEVVFKATIPEDVKKTFTPELLSKVKYHTQKKGGHVGALGVIKSNPKIYNRLNKIYNASKKSELAQKIRKNYQREMKKDPKNAENLIFSEWVAYNVEDQLANPKKRGAAYHVVKAVKQFLIDIGISKDSVDDVMRSMVKEIRKVKTGEAGLVEMVKDKKAAKLKEPVVLYSKKLPPKAFYSPTDRTISGLKQEKGVVPQISSMIKKGQLKKAEVEWMGLEDFLKENPKATKSEVLDFVRSNEVEVEETEKGADVPYKREDLEVIGKDKFGKIWKIKAPGQVFNLLTRLYPTKEKAIQHILNDKVKEPDETKYSQYTLPGGENYRELLFKMPRKRKIIPLMEYKNWVKFQEELNKEEEIYDEKTIYSTTIKEYEKYKKETEKQIFYEEGYKTSHWDEPNVFAHARVNDRTTPEGDKVLFIEEIQSDWAREAREKGVKKAGAKPTDEQVVNYFGLSEDADPADFRDEMMENPKWQDAGVPDFPFRKNWQEYALKNILRKATEEGYDRISWVTGEQTADRYDLSKQLDAINWIKQPDNIMISGFRDKQKVIENNDISPKDLPSVVGKDITKKILDSDENGGTLEGVDLKVGGAWAKNLYDKMIPKFLDKYAKKWGAKTEEIELGTRDKLSLKDMKNGWYAVIDMSGKNIGEAKGKTNAQEMLEELEENGIQQLSLPITPEMKKGVMEGQPLFSKQLSEKKEIDKRKIDGVQVDAFTGAEYDAAQAYESAKDAWIGEKDVRILKAQVEKSKLQKRIKNALGLKSYTNKAKLYDQAIQIYIDSKRSPGDFKKFKDKLSSEQKYIYKLSQELPPELKKIADEISESYQAMGFEAAQSELIKSVLDNYAGRIWELEEKKGKPTVEAMRKFGTKTGHAKARKFATIIEGQAAGYNLKVKGATNNLQILKDSLVKTIEDKRFLKSLQQIKTIDGDPLVTTEEKEDYVKLEHPNLSSWKFAGNADPDKVYGKNFFVTPEGTLLERRDLYAPKAQAKNLNNILGVSRLKDVPGIKQATKYNAIFKAWILQSSFFHHLAFMRSYELGTLGKKFGELSPIQATKQGIKAIESESPIIQQLVRNGLTLGLKQDWNEELLQEKTIIGKILDKTKATKAVKDKILDLRERQAEFLFGTMGSGLKAKAAMIEYRNITKHHPNMDTNRAAKMAANLINDDFGGLHLQRMGRNPTLQHIFRFFALAPDWTESNIRSMVKMVGAGTKEERAMYRRFWAGIATKGVLLTVAANALFSIGAEDEDEKFFTKLKRAWGTGKDWKKLKWLDVDITNMYKALGGKSADRKYFSIIGHFKDPLKFATSTVKSAHHKGSVIYKTFFELLSGEDWAGRRFTTLPELLGVDSDLGKREAEKLKGKTVTWKKGGHGGSTLPSYLLAQARGLQPVQVQNLISYVAGEMEGFDALMNSMGLGVRTTYGGEEGRFAKNKRRIKKVKDEYKYYIEKRQPEKAKKLIQKNKKLFQLESQMKAFDKKLRVLKKARDFYEDKKDKKKAELLTKKINEMLNNFNKSFDARTK